MKLWLLLILTLGLFANLSAQVQRIRYAPSPYFSERDSPFYGGIVDNAGNGIYLEDFEDQQLNTPFVNEPVNGRFFGTTFRSIFPDDRGTVWSVDGDDGSVDGNTFDGDAWITISRAQGGPAGEMEFIFEPDDLGRLPRYVGFVATRVLDVDRDVEFTFDNERGFSLYGDELDPKEWAPPGGAGGGDPRRHRFIGLYHENGIRRLFVSNLVNLDHLQYGYSIPEPGSSLLIVLSTVLILGRRRR